MPASQSCPLSASTDNAKFSINKCRHSAQLITGTGPSDHQNHFTGQVGTLAFKKENKRGSANRETETKWKRRRERERENHPQKTRLNLNTVSQVQSTAEKELTPLVTYTMTIFTVFYKVFKNLVPKPWDFPSGLFSKASAFNAGDPGLIPASGTSSEEGNGNPLQYSCLENPMDGGTW